MSSSQDDENMINTISNLVDMLDTTDAAAAAPPPPSGATSAESSGTNEVIDKISSLIDDLNVGEESFAAKSYETERKVNVSSTSEAYRTPMPPMKTEDGEELTFSSNLPPSVELPAHPTPYELWQKAHKPPKTLGPTPLEFVNSIPVKERSRRVAQVTERLMRRQRQEHFSMMMKQHKKLANELRGLTFTPNLHRTQEKNKRIVQTYEPLYKRYKHEIETAKISKLKLEDELRTRELSKCTFRPKISASAKKISKEQNRQPVEERCIQFGLEKEEWAKQRREIIKRLELDGATFRPKLSKKSREICASISKPKAQDRVRKFRVKNNSLDAGHEEDVFHPKINHRSERKTSKTGVFKRLYARAKSQNLKRTAFARRYLNKFVQGISMPKWAQDHTIPANFRDNLAALGGVERSELREHHYSEKGIRAHVCSKDYTNVIEWKKEYSFLIPRLQGA